MAKDNTDRQTLDAFSKPGPGRPATSQLTRREQVARAVARNRQAKKAAGLVRFEVMLDPEVKTFLTEIIQKVPEVKSQADAMKYWYQQTQEQMRASFDQ